ncbi:MAG: phosphate propanoyltransferase [Butyricicoccus sp.]|nr:phosphate propanoyltransferase [Butyricicoccus sp.]
MEQIIQAVLSAIPRAGLVEVEVSARHVHLTREHLEILFGKGAELTPKRPLSQPGQFLSEERVTLVGPKGRKERTAILGPIRPATQVELSKSDCVELGVKAPVRESGDVAGSGSITIEGPCGSLTIDEGVIIAHNHVHLTPEVAQIMGVTDKQRVAVEVFSDRPVTFRDVIIRVSEKFSCRMHIDFDEANAALISGFTLGKIIK